MKTALVTGSSRGIGRAIALRLAHDGFKVVLHGAKNREKAEEVKRLIEEAGGQAEVVICDLSAPDRLEPLLEKASHTDLLVLNASVQIKKKWEEITLEDCNTQLSTNFISSLALIQAAVPHMKKEGFGRIITVGSVQEAKPHPDMLVYSASKAAQTNMAKSLSLQLAPFGITVNNLAPGVIFTDRNVEALSDPEYAKKVTASIPVGYYGIPDDCAGVVSLLCSDEGRYITGQSIYVDGGKSVL